MNRLVDESNERFRKGDWDGVIAKTSEALRDNDSNVVARVNRTGSQISIKA